MGAERNSLLPNAYPVYFARVSRSGRVRHAIRIPEANQDFATYLEVPPKAGADWPVVTRCGPARNSLTGNQPLPWPFPDPQSRSLRGARNSLAQTQDYTTSQERRKPPIPLPSGLSPRVIVTRARCYGVHSSAESNLGKTTIRTFILPIARWRTPGGIRTERPTFSGMRSSFTCIAAPGPHSST